ncbi:TRAP transporter large permease [candidate division NPL-UPA2 bacterium]|nr:TRAP transporter large permease [candidate division NPL-UPA2 bacterium]
MEIWLLLLLFVGILLFFFVIGLPVGFSLGLTTVVLMLLDVGPGFNTAVLASRMFHGLNAFVLLAIPFFLLAGKIMNAGGMTNRIFDFARAMVGSLKGGMCHVNIVASMIFAGMSGVAIADAVGIGTVAYKAMTDDGYPPEFSVGITAASSTIGSIIPPSLSLVLYAILAGVSVGEMLVAGLLPGILIGVTLAIMVWIVSSQKGYPAGAKFNRHVFIASFKQGVLALGTPAILLGGIITGFFTVTEAAAMAVLYAVILGLFVYKELTFSELWSITKQSMIDSATIFFVIAAATAYGFLVVHSRIPIILAEAMLGITENPLIILLLLNVFLLTIGLFLDSLASITILVPILVPIIEMAGIDPVHFGVVMVFNLLIGLLTPPFGALLFVLTKSTGLKLERIFQGVLPFYIPLIIALLIFTFFPQVVLFLPTLAGFR